MCESVEVLAIIDDVNKVYYTEEKTFALGSEEAKQAEIDYLSLLQKAKMNGYQIVKKEKTAESDPMNEGIMAMTEERINKIGGRSR